MSKISIDAATVKRALDALEYWDVHGGLHQPTEEAITAIKAALAQPEQEPVAWITPDGEGFRIRFSPPTNDVPLGWDALYTTPPQRIWVGLTDEEAQQTFAKHNCTISTHLAGILARAIEAKLKEKNT